MGEGSGTNTTSSTTSSASPEITPQDAATTSSATTSSLTFPLFLVDNSRIKLGRIGCERARYHEYHSGPTGYGIRLKRQSMPLATGIGLHNGIARLLKWSLKNAGGQRLPPRDVAREIINGVAYAYYKRVGARGFVELRVANDELAKRTTIEQVSLIQGLLWGAYRTILPQLLQEYRVLHVEEEGAVFPVGCTCGLGDGVPPHTAHAARGCEATGAMSKSDMILERLADATVVNCDAKSAGDVTEWSWAERQNQGLQFALQTAAARMIGYQVTETLVLGLNKGWRSAQKEKDEETGKCVVTRETAEDKRQDSIFCWAYRKPAAPPMQTEEWRASYNYKEVDPKTGEMVGRTIKGKGYTKAPVWEAQFPGKPADWSVMEYWVEFLPIETVAHEFKIAGPFTTPEHKLRSILRSIASEGRAWKLKLWRIYAALEEAGWDFAAESVQAVLDVEAPQSWNCIQYKRDCSFRYICDRKDGWERPLETGIYELRTPHHETEREQAVSRGIELPPDQEEDEDGE